MGSRPPVPEWLAADWRQRGVKLTVAYQADPKAQHGRLERREMGVLSDPAVVASCIPGAELTETGEGDKYQGTMRVKFGPTVAMPLLQHLHHLGNRKPASSPAEHVECRNHEA